MTITTESFKRIFSTLDLFPHLMWIDDDLLLSMVRDSYDTEKKYHDIAKSYGILSYSYNNYTNEYHLELYAKYGMKCPEYIWQTNDFTFQDLFTTYKNKYLMR